ncbi:MAG: hypothetical protein ACOC1K_01545 [Nanoarchaeota archaeon]
MKEIKLLISCEDCKTLFLAEQSDKSLDDCKKCGSSNMTWARSEYIIELLKNDEKILKLEEVENENF